MMCTVLRPETLVVFHVEINDAVMQRTMPRSQLPAPPHHARGGSPSLYFSDASEKTLFVFFQPLSLSLFRELAQIPYSDVDGGF